MKSWNKIIKGQSSDSTSLRFSLSTHNCRICVESVRLLKTSSIEIHVSDDMTSLLVRKATPKNKGYKLTHSNQTFNSSILRRMMGNVVGSFGGVYVPETKCIIYDMRKSLPQKSGGRLKGGTNKPKPQPRRKRTSAKYFEYIAKYISENQIHKTIITGQTKKQAMLRLLDKFPNEQINILNINRF